MLKMSDRRIIFLVTFIVHFAWSSSVVFPSHRNNLCIGVDARFPNCVEVKKCEIAHEDILAGRHPVICGWAGLEPLVCCGDDRGRSIDDGSETAFINKISRISPKGCGKREETTSENHGTTDREFVYPKENEDDIFPGEIEPRTPELSPALPFNISTYAGNEGTLDFKDVFFAVGGVSATAVWPWMTAIFVGNSSKQLCGGVAIDDKHILTASHCFAGRSLNPKHYKVLVGEIILDNTSKRYQVQEIKMHESYLPRYYYHDIAILRLQEPMKEDVIPVCVPVEDDVQEGDNVTVLGWGDLSFGGPSSAILQEVHQIPIVKTDKCNVQYRKIATGPFPRGITDNFICAGLDEGGKDACQGDSGGPLIHQNKEGIWSVVGIVSFGHMCAEPGYPGVYTRVASYAQWIENYIRNENELLAEVSLPEFVEEKSPWKPIEKVFFPS